MPIRLCFWNLRTRIRVPNTKAYASALCSFSLTTTTALVLHILRRAVNLEDAFELFQVG